MKELEKLLKGLAPESFIKRGMIGLKANWDPIRILFEQRRVPLEGWQEDQVKSLFKLLSTLDTDKDPEAARVGEREARVISPFLSDLAGGFSECFRVLKPYGSLIFKWNEYDFKVSEILELAPYQPLFGHKSGKMSLTHWIAFTKPNNGLQRTEEHRC